MPQCCSCQSFLKRISLFTTISYLAPICCPPGNWDVETGSQTPSSSSLPSSNRNPGSLWRLGCRWRNTTSHLWDVADMSSHWTHVLPIQVSLRGFFVVNTYVCVLHVNCFCPMKWRTAFLCLFFVVHMLNLAKSSWALVTFNQITPKCVLYLDDCMDCC